MPVEIHLPFSIVPSEISPQDKRTLLHLSLAVGLVGVLGAFGAFGLGRQIADIGDQLKSIKQGKFSTDIADVVDLVNTRSGDILGEEVSLVITGTAGVGMGIMNGARYFSITKGKTH